VYRKIKEFVVRSGRRMMEMRGRSGERRRAVGSTSMEYRG